VATYDLIVVGSGPGGYVAAIRAGQLGLKTALVERDRGRLGGTCLHRGCIPTKALLHAARLYEETRHMKEWGIEADGVKLNWKTVQKRKEKILDQLNRGIQSLLKKNKVEVLAGSGRLQGARTVAVDGAPHEARAVILATGSEPRPLPGLSGPSVLTSNEALTLEQVPASLLVVGSGAVGSEFASLYASLGARVALVELLPRILPLEDAEVSAAMAKIFARRGIEVHVGTKVERLDGASALLSNGKTVPAEKVLVAVGRKPNTDGIGLETTRARLDRGFVKVDGFMQTDDPGLFAIGDIVPTPALAHVATAEGILAVEKIAGREVRPLNYDRIPNVTFTSPQVASIGLTEEKARERGYAVKIGRFPFAALGKSQILGETEGFVKIVADARYGEILGIHAVHERAGDLIGESTAALAGELTLEDLAHAVHAHPTLSEAFLEAAHGGLGAALHM
jgi:dihydrolipoamide dehydrogenase